MFQLGVDVLLNDQKLLTHLKTKRVALLGHPASVTGRAEHSLDALRSQLGQSLCVAFGPQHGMRGDKQYNMIETEDDVDDRYQIPVFSLYGKVRRPTDEMIDTFDVVLVDLQDVGCRIYTYITTLLYMMQACSAKGKSVWVLDRPNPIGRPVEGLMLDAGWESFVGAGPMVIRHGLTIGELALWFQSKYCPNLDLNIISMNDYSPESADSGYGWPQDLAWVNPSPNAPSVTMARCFPGAVMLEGTNLSEGRGTTRPLELVGAPQLDIEDILEKMQRLAPQWLQGCLIRTCSFEPTFYKYQGKLCRGIQVHPEGRHYQHKNFKPYRLFSILLKAVRIIHPDIDLWRKFDYEYEFGKMAIDIINGGPFFKQWVDNPLSTAQDLERRLIADEKAWTEDRQKFLKY